MENHCDCPLRGLKNFLLTVDNFDIAEALKDMRSTVQMTVTQFAELIELPKEKLLVWEEGFETPTVKELAHIYMTVVKYIDGNEMPKRYIDLDETIRAIRETMIERYGVEVVDDFVDLLRICYLTELDEKDEQSEVSADDCGTT